MEAKDVFTLGLGLSAPWKLASHRLDIDKRPHELHLEVIAERGASFPCADCGRACKAHDFESFRSCPGKWCRSAGVNALSC